jgi:alkanesulfonate monooxygenase
VFPLLGKGKQGGEHSLTGPFGEVMASDIVPKTSVPKKAA